MDLLGSTFAHAIAFAFRGEHGGVMGQPIEERGGQLLVAREDGRPFGKCEVGRHDCRPSLVAVGDQIEEQLAADAVEGHKPELVDDQDVDPEESLLQPGELAGIARFDQLPDEIRRSGKEHASLLLRRLDPERNREVRFAGPDRASENQILRAR